MALLFSHLVKRERERDRQTETERERERERWLLNVNGNLPFLCVSCLTYEAYLPRGAMDWSVVYDNDVSLSN